MYLHISTSYFSSTPPTTPYNVALGYEEEIIVAKLAGFALTTHYLGTCFRFLVQNMQKKINPRGAY